MLIKYSTPNPRDHTQQTLQPQDDYSIKIPVIAEEPKTKFHDQLPNGKKQR